MGNKIVKIKLMETDSLEHYGIKGMEWGKLKKEDLKKPFPLSSDLPKVEPRVYGTKVSEKLKRTTYELNDNVKNKITNFDKVPRFNPKDETLDTAYRKVNESYEFSDFITEDDAKKYGLYDADGTLNTFGNNCPSATFAYELRRRGYDVEAGITGGATNQEILDVFNISKLEYTKEQLKNSIPPQKIEKLIKNMEDMGPGARGFCLMDWGDGSGHISSFEVNTKGKVVFIDAQTGLSSEDHFRNEKLRPAEYYKRTTKYTVIRTDNRKINTEAFKKWVRVDDRIDPKEVARTKALELYGINAVSSFVGKNATKKLSTLLPKKNRYINTDILNKLRGRD